MRSDERITHNGRVYVPLAPDVVLAAGLLLMGIGAGVSIYWLGSVIVWAARALQSCS